MLKKTIGFALCGALIAVAALAGCSAGPGAVVDASGGISMVSRTSGKYFQVYDGHQWTGHVIKGADIGASAPGSWPGDLAIKGSQYAAWLKGIASMNANTILVYALMKPEFYAALDDYNRANPGKRLWLFQQVWPDDVNVGTNLYAPAYADMYEKEIKLDVDALMGNAKIAQRQGKAWGKYSRNVMPYVLGMVIGRELTSEEVAGTNAANAGTTSHDGLYVHTTTSSNAMEVWCAQMSDILETQVSTYKWQVPVGFVSWPTLDPIVHPTENTPGEPKSKEVDDSLVLDPRHLGPGKDAKAGFFGMYQIYPYYPEFIYRDPTYAQYSDSQGTLRYGGYLKDFMSIHPDYPAVVGEFGLPTSVSSSHQQPEGLSQGGITEQAQGIDLSRMYDAILREGYAGGLVFEWADEWSKRNWVTMPYMIPFERHILWDNVTDPEQCFGLLDYESMSLPAQGSMKRLWSVKNVAGPAKDGDIKAVYATSNEAFLFLAFDIQGASKLLPGSNPGMALNVGISTLGPGHGTVKLPVAGTPAMPDGVEFLLQIDGSGGLFLCRPDYNRASSKFWAAPSSDMAFEHTTYVINRAQIDLQTGQFFPRILTDQSVLRYGNFDRSSPQFDSLGNWFVASGTRLIVRLPWALLNVTDPSSQQVIYDKTRDLPIGPVGMRNLPLDALNTMKTPGFLFYSATTVGGNLAGIAPQVPGKNSFDSSVGPWRWQGWNTPSVQQQHKASLEYVKETFAGVNASAIPPQPSP